MDSKDSAKNIKLLIFDVDGVLTSGQLIFSHSGDALKFFHVQDGLGITAAHKAGLKTAIITGRESEMVRLRGAELNITDVYQGKMNKVAALTELTAKHGLNLNQVAYAGDDLNDLPVMIRVGLACAVANAVPEVKAHAHFITTQQGGQGAVREIIEFILKAQGKWDDIVNSYVETDSVEVRQ